MSTRPAEYAPGVRQSPETNFPANWRHTFAQAMGGGRLLDHPEHATPALRSENRKALNERISEVTRTNTSAHWIAALNKAGVPCGPINNVKQAIAHPQVAARNMLVEVPDGSGGTLTLAGNPLKMSAFEDPKTRRAAPDLDSDRQAILSYLGG